MANGTNGKGGIRLSWKAVGVVLTLAIAGIAFYKSIIIDSVVLAQVQEECTDNGNLAHSNQLLIKEVATQSTVLKEYMKEGFNEMKTEQRALRGDIRRLHTA